MLEIGPGRGILTRALLARGAKPVVVELDRRFLPELRKMDISVLPGDALKVPEEIPAFLEENEVTTIVGNLPYYAATAILLRYLVHLQRVSRMVFMFQKEVADRITARPGHRPYGSLSVLAQVYARPSQAFSLPPGAFSPPPEVSSAVVVFDPGPLPEIPFESFSRFVSVCFRQPRKTLANNLKEQYPEYADRVGRVRPAELEPWKYIRLYKEVEKEWTC